MDFDRLFIREKEKMTLNSQLSLHTRSNDVLVLFLDRLQPHFKQLLGFRNL